jgi:hypothetical protein
VVLACLANFETNEALAPRFGVERLQGAKLLRVRLISHVTSLVALLSSPLPSLSSSKSSSPSLHPQLLVCQCLDHYHVTVSQTP